MAPAAGRKTSRGQSPRLDTASSVIILQFRRFVVPPQTPMNTVTPIAAITVDSLAPERFKEFVLASEHGRYPGHLSLGPIQGISNPKVELFFAPPNDLSLRFISSQPLTPEAFDEVQIACTYLATHPDTVFDAVRAIFPAEASAGTLNLSLKLICPGFTDNWRDAMHWWPYPTEVLELALATDAHGRQSVITRSSHFRKKQRKPTARLGRRVPRSKQMQRYEHEPPPRTRIALGDPLRRSAALSSRELEVQEIDAFLNDVLPEPTAMRTRTRSRELDCLNMVQRNLVIYAKTVALSARLLFRCTPSRDKTGKRPNGLSPVQARRMLQGFLPVLGTLARYFGKTAPDLFALRLPSAGEPRDLDSMLKKLASKYSTERHANLSANWQTGVPSTFAAFLEEMLPSAVGLPQEVAFDANITESAEQILGNAAIGVIASVYAASSCDMLWRYPETFVANPFQHSLTPAGAFDAVPSLRFLRADLVRVVCAHRVMLEMAGLPDRSIAVAILSQAVRVAQEVRTKVVLNYGSDDGRAEVWASGRESLVPLQAKDTLRASKKNQSDLLDLCVAQEPDTRRFFAAVP
jgi:hypothetical protein